MLKKLLLLFKRGCLWISLNLISSSNNFTIVQFTTIKMLSDAKKITFYRCITNLSTVREALFFTLKEKLLFSWEFSFFKLALHMENQKRVHLLIAKQTSLRVQVKFHN